MIMSYRWLSYRASLIGTYRDSLSGTTVRYTLPPSEQCSFRSFHHRDFFFRQPIQPVHLVTCLSDIFPSLSDSHTFIMSDRWLSDRFGLVVYDVGDAHGGFSIKDTLTL